MGSEPEQDHSCRVILHNMKAASVFLFGVSLHSALSQSSGPKFYKTKFTDCGSLLNIAPALQGPVRITAPYHSKKGRHILGKGKTVKICINATIEAGSLPLPIAGAGLKNSAHGKLQLGGCSGISPACENLNYGQSVQLCSALQVPTASPDVDVEVTWKVLREEVSDPTCEKEYDLAKLAQKGKTPLVCINIPARVQPPRTG